MTEEKELGKITSTFLGIEDHGIFAFALTFDFGGTGQGFGPISNPSPQTLKSILRALNVDSWEKVKGKTAYAIRKQGSQLIVGIEGLPFENGKRFVIGDVKEVETAA